MATPRSRSWAARSSASVTNQISRIIGMIIGRRDVLFWM
jgi:hypothetical protein